MAHLLREASIHVLSQSYYELTFCVLCIDEYQQYHALAAIVLSSLVIDAL